MVRPVGDVRSKRRAAPPSATALEIERVALTLFAERGFDRVTAALIAGTAGVSVRTFYRCFPDGKEGVVLMETRRAVDLFAAELRRRPADEPAHLAVREALLASMQQLDDAETDGIGFGVAGARRVYAQIESQNTSLLARLIGERVLMFESLVGEVALRMSLDPSTDPRPRLLLQAANAAVSAGWFTMQASRSSDRLSITRQALDVLDAGFADLAPTLESRSHS